MNIATIKINRLAGPVSFAFLQPQSSDDDTLLSQIIKQTSPLMLLGDHHNCFKEVCEIDSTTVFTNSQYWFKLLDLFGTDNFPVQYYVESAYFDTSILEDPFYKQFHQGKWLTNTSTHSFMTYIWKNYPYCFVNPKNSKVHFDVIDGDIEDLKCITKHIQYNLADLRQTIKNLNLKDTHEAIMKAQSDAWFRPVHKTLFSHWEKRSEEAMRRKKSFVGKSREVIDYYLKAKLKEINKKTKDKEDVEHMLFNDEIRFKMIDEHFEKEEALPYFESKFYVYLSSYVNLLYSLNDKDKPPNEINIDNGKLIMLYHAKEYRKCAAMIFDLKNPSFAYSVLYQTIQKLANMYKENKTVIKECREMFIDYFEFYSTYQMNKVNQDDDIKTNFEKMLNMHIIDFEIIDMHKTLESQKVINDLANRYIFNPPNNSQLMHEDLYQNNKYFYTTKYPSICHLISTLMLAPINDMNMLFDSWAKKSPLTVYNCGNAHSICMYHFLTSKGYYKSETGLLGKDDFNDKPNKDIHCIYFNPSKPLFLDPLLWPHLQHEEQQEKLKLNNKRIEVLGLPLFRCILKGRKILFKELSNSKSLNDYIEKHGKSLHQVLTELKLSIVDTLEVQ